MFERKSVSLFVLVCVVMYVIIFKIIDRLPKYLTDWQYICLADCDSSTCQKVTKNLRDAHYWIDEEGYNKMNPIKCSFTMYELTHLLFHVWIGYEYGIFVSIGLSAFFEIFEHIFYDCGSVLDLMWNLIGGLIGISLRYYVNRQK
jgi:hypothetical protein